MVLIIDKLEGYGLRDLLDAPVTPIAPQGEAVVAIGIQEDELHKEARRECLGSTEGVDREAG